jgi:hypothetical protein
VTAPAAETGVPEAPTTAIVVARATTWLFVSTWPDEDDARACGRGTLVAGYDEGARGGEQRDAVVAGSAT